MIRPSDIAKLLQVDPGEIGRVRPVQGGCLNEAYRLSVGGETVFVKYNGQPVDRLFEAEAEGLRLLRDTGTVTVPEVLAMDRHHLILSWVEPAAVPETRSAALLGSDLARLHRTPLPAYGLPAGNVVGVPQPKSPLYDAWVPFYREQRLAPLASACARQGLLPEARQKRLVRLLDRLEEWIDPSVVRPSLLHGDLWSGNWLTGPGGRPVLVDPAVLYGDRESELAFTELFGGFPESFYAAYREAWPLEAGYEDRRPLYQLYHLLVHLYLFGESYGSSVDRTLSRYVG